MLIVFNDDSLVIEKCYAASLIAKQKTAENAHLHSIFNAACKEILESLIINHSSTPIPTDSYIRYLVTSVLRDNITERKGFANIRIELTEGETWMWHRIMEAFPNMDLNFSKSNIVLY